MNVSKDEVTDVVRENLDFYDQQRRVWRYYRSAFKNQFWSCNMWQEADIWKDSQDDGLPFKVEVNRVWPFVQALVANLFYRQPRTQVNLPDVMDAPAPGRPAGGQDDPDIVMGYLDEFLRRSGVREQSTNGYQLALMYGESAFKVGFDKDRKGDILSRTFVQAVPRWELIMDREASSLEQQAFRGHIRWERIDRAREIVGGDLGDVQPEPLTDFLDLGYGSSTGPDDQRKLAKYVRLLEFYDLLADEQRFYIVRGQTARAMDVIPVGKTGKAPGVYPDGQPAIPLIPIVLSNVPDFPCQGVPAVSRIYELNAEQNLLLTILANAVRREAGRILFANKGSLDSKAQGQIARGRDLEIVEVDENVNIDKVMKGADIPPMSSTLDKHVALIASAWSDTQGASDLMQGKQGDYLSATEASLLAGFGEATSGDIQQRMSFALASTCRLLLAMTATAMQNPISVRVGKSRKQLTTAICEMPWTVSIVDSASTPVKDMRKKEAFLQVQPQLIQLTAIAAGGPGEDGQTAPPEVQRLAQEMLNYMQQLWALPESMSWDSLQTAAKKAATSPEDKAKIEAILAKLAPQQVPGGVPITPGAPGVGVPGSAPTAERITPGLPNGGV